MNKENKNTNYREFAIDSAKEAGRIIRESFGLGMERKYKQDNSPVTVTDTKINDLVIERVNTEFPGHDILAEERSDLSGHSEYVWVCDPVDGTLPFSHGIPTCAFSLALVKNGEPILGVIYDPFMERLYVGEKGKGAKLNGETVSVSQKDAFQNSLVGMDGDTLGSIFEVAKEFRENQGSSVIRFHSIVNSSSYVINGEMIVSIFFNTTAHDIAALKILIEEAGGKVTDIYGNEQRYDREIRGAVMSNGVVHDEVLELVKKYVK